MGAGVVSCVSKVSYFLTTLSLLGIVDNALNLLQGQVAHDGDDGKLIFCILQEHELFLVLLAVLEVDGGLFSVLAYPHQFLVSVSGVDVRGFLA